MQESIEVDIRYNSLATRLSNLEPKDFDKFMKAIEPKGGKSKQLDNIDHEAQMKKLTR